ncbi:MAG: hypothetical protein ACI4AH_06140, partial [Muribaculaceae bacterium]
TRGTRHPYYVIRLLNYGLTDKIGIERLRVFFSGDNLAEWSGLYKYYKVDPESLGNFIYPFQRSYSFGLNLTF